MPGAKIRDSVFIIMLSRFAPKPCLSQSQRHCKLASRNAVDLSALALTVLAPAVIWNAKTELHDSALLTQFCSWPVFVVNCVDACFWFLERTSTCIILFSTSCGYKSLCLELQSFRNQFEYCIEFAAHFWSSIRPY